MEKYLSAGSSFVRRQYAPHLLLTLLFALMSGLFVSFRNLDGVQAAKVMELYASFGGILLLNLKQGEFPQVFGGSHVCKEINHRYHISQNCLIGNPADEKSDALAAAGILLREQSAR